MSETQAKYPYKEAILSDSKGDLKKIWYVNYYAWSETKGRLVRKRGTFDQPTAAERYEKAQEFIEAINEALKEGQILDPLPVETPEISGNSPLDKATQHFLATRKKIISKNTFRGYEKDVRTFTDWAEKAKLEKLPLSKFSTKEVFMFSDYLDNKVVTKKDRSGNEVSKVGVAKKTYSNFISTLRTMWEFYMERKILKENPFLDVKKRRGASSQHIPYTPAQVRKFKQLCFEKLEDEQLWLFANFIYYGFFRPREEAQNLQVKHILKRTILVPGEIAKNNESEHVRIPKGLEALLQKYKIRDYPPNHYVFSREKIPGEERVGINYFYERNRKVLDLAGFTDKEYDLYGWKHTGVIALYLKTKDIKLIQAQCRHKDINTTDKYLRDLGLFLDEDAMDLFPEAGEDH